VTALADGCDVILVTVHEFLSSHVSYKLIYLLGVGSSDIAASLETSHYTTLLGTAGRGYRGDWISIPIPIPYPQINRREVCVQQGFLAVVDRRL